MSKYLKKFLIIWVPLAFVVISTSLLSYLLVQQNMRQAANDPQIQLAEEVVAALEGGRTPETIISGIKVNINTSLASFVIIYDKDKKQLAASALLDNNPVDVPEGVLTDVKFDQQNRVTWQPAAGVRSAIVVQKFNNGYVVVGRSLREVEIRIQKAMVNTLIGTVAILIGSAGVLAATFMGITKWKQKQEN